MSESFDTLKFGDGMQTPSRVVVFQQLDYHSNHSEDGGQIRRVFFCQPFTAAKSLLIALRGTFVPDGNDGTLKRVHPHNDPVHPNYYCVDAEVVPLDREAVTGSAGSGFTPNPNNTPQQDMTGLRAALDTFPANFDYDATLDSLDLGEIRKGQPRYTGSTDTKNSYGTCGALVTAIYKPLIFAKGLSQSVDPFDYVDPQMQPFTKTETLGRDLQFVVNFIDPFGNGNALTRGMKGVADAAVVAESCVTFTIRRLMVPYYPVNHFSCLNNKLNFGSMQFGDLNFPKGTMRMMAPEAVEKLTPDGQRYWDFTLSWQVRLVYDSYWDNPSKNMKKGWVSWNHYLGYPTFMGVNGSLGFGYFPVGWNDGLFQYFGNYRYLYLYDNQIQYLDSYRGNGNEVDGSIYDLFTCGFKQEILKQ